MIGTEVMTMLSGRGLQMAGFCLVVDLARGGSMSNGATPSSL